MGHKFTEAEGRSAICALRLFEGAQGVTLAQLEEAWGVKKPTASERVTRLVAIGVLRREGRMIVEGPRADAWRRKWGLTDRATESNCRTFETKE